MESNRTGRRMARAGTWEQPPSRQVAAPAPAPPVRPCCCTRPNTVIVCRMCGYIHSSARVSRICPVHPRTSYLSDMKQCPKCYSQRLVEMTD